MMVLAGSQGRCCSEMPSVELRSAARLEEEEEEEQTVGSQDYY